jgi:hypothetical protein
VFAPPPNHRESLALLEQALEHTRQDRRLDVRLLSWLANALSYVGEYVTAEERARDAVDDRSDSTRSDLARWSQGALNHLLRSRSPMYGSPSMM